jgi:hypothetical protein
VSSYQIDSDRTETRATRSHNTVEVDGHDSCEVWAAFRVGRRCTARLLEHGQTSDESWAAAEHDGYRWLPGSPVHTRRLGLRSGRLVIADAIPGATAGVSRLHVDARGDHRVTVTSSDAHVERTHGNWYPFHGASRPAVVYAQHTTGNVRSGWNLTWASAMR